MATRYIQLPEGWKARVMDEGLPTAKVLRRPRKSLGDLFTIQNCKGITDTLRKKKINVLLATTNDDREMENTPEIYWSPVPRPSPDTPTEFADMVDVISAIRSEDTRSVIRKVISHSRRDSWVKKHTREILAKLLSARYRRSPWGINAERVGNLCASLFIGRKQQPKSVQRELQEVTAGITSFVSSVGKLGVVQWKNRPGLLVTVSNRDTVHRRADDEWHTDGDSFKGFERLSLFYKPHKPPHALHRALVEKDLGEWKCSVESHEKGATKKF